MTLTLPAQLLAREHDLLFRAAVKNNVMFGVTFDPLALDESVGGRRIEGIVTHGKVLSFDLGIAKQIGPVIEVVDLDPLSRYHLGRAPGSRRKGEHHKLAVIGNPAVRAMAGPLKPGFERFSGALSQCWMV